MPVKIQHIPGQYPDNDLFKYNYIKNIARKFNCNCLVEFGTHEGNCAITLQHDFTKIITIEPVKQYYDLSKNKFANLSNIEILNTKAIDFIKSSLDGLQKYNTLFWVDSHIQPPFTNNASNDLYEEVEHIFNLMTCNQYILLIDDYRLWSKFCNKESLIDLLEKRSEQVTESSDMVLCVPLGFKHE